MKGVDPVEYFSQVTHAEGKAMLDLLAKARIVTLSLGGLVKCPGKELHTSPSRDTDCALYFNPVNGHWVPRLHCFHGSCQEKVSKANRLMCWLANQETRCQPVTVTLPATPRKPVFTTPSVNLQDVTINHPWSVQQIASDPSYGVNEPANLHHLLLLGLFDPDDIIWIGELYQSRDPRWAAHFRKASFWMTHPNSPGIYVCPNPLKPGSLSRSNAMIQAHKFFVVESDDLTHDEAGAVFKWMQHSGHTLRAVVDTGNKSLHGWFDYPAAALLPGLKQNLVALKCDPKMFSPSQPCRLPGTIRPTTRKYQSLIYLKP